jgi:hypothetical protein
MFRQHLIHSARMLRRKPGFTLVAVLSLALGIAANTTIFNIANRISVGLCARRSRAGELGLGAGVPGLEGTGAKLRADRRNVRLDAVTKRSVLWGVTPTDPATFVVVSAMLVAIALLACVEPTRRALALDPAVTLRKSA